MNVVRKYHVMAAICCFVAVGGPVRLVLDYDEIPNGVILVFLLSVYFISTTSFLAAFTLLKIAKNVRLDTNFDACVNASRFMLILIPLGFVFGFYSLHLLAAERKPETDSLQQRSP